MKEFITAATEADQPTDSLTFKVDGRECVAYRPSDGQLAVLMATSSRHSTQQDQIAGAINFFAAVVDSNTHTWLVSRLLDRDDPFGVEQVTAILEYMIEEWTARPTVSPSGSTQSPQGSGPASSPITTPST